MFQSVDSLDIPGGVKNWHVSSFKNYSYDNIQGVVPTSAADASRYIMHYFKCDNMKIVCSMYEYCSFFLCFWVV